MSTRTTLPIAFFLAVPLAAAQDELLFTPEAATNARTRAALGVALRRISPEEVAAVVPDPGGSSAEKFAPLQLWNVLLGDEDGDSTYFERPLADVVDAVFIPCAAGSPVDQEDLCISTKIAIGSAGFGRDITPGDLFWLRSDGTVEFFLREAQIRSAFSIPTSDTVDVDAAAMDGDGNLYLSFDDDVHVGTTLLRDGGIAELPASAMVRSTCAVDDALAGKGYILAPETTVDSWCYKAKAADATGAWVTQIGDLEGLEVDPAGGTITIQNESDYYTIPNLLFCGENLTGGGVLSTAGGGSIAVINGTDLASPAGTPTTGEQVGLESGTVDWLNSLAICSPTVDFVLDTSTPIVAGAGSSVAVEFGGAGTFGHVLLNVGLGPTGPGGAATAVATTLAGFPEFYAPSLPPLMLSSGPLGMGGFVATCPSGIPAGTTLVLQAMTLIGGKLALSTPMVLQF